MGRKITIISTILCLVAVGGITVKLTNDKYSWIDKYEQNIKYKSSRFILDENDIIKDVSNFKNTNKMYTISGCKYYIYELEFCGEKAYASFYNAPTKEEIDFINGGASGNKLFLKHDYRINNINVFNEKQSYRAVIYNYEELIEGYVYGVDFSLVLNDELIYKSEYINLEKYKKSSSNELIIDDERYVGNIEKEDILSLKIAETTNPDNSLVTTSEVGTIGDITYSYSYPGTEKNILANNVSGPDNKWISLGTDGLFVLDGVDLTEYDIYICINHQARTNIISYLSQNFITISSSKIAIKGSSDFETPISIWKR